jgi:cell division protease FtsH
VGNKKISPNKSKSNKKKSNNSFDFSSGNMKNSGKNFLIWILIITSAIYMAKVLSNEKPPKYVSHDEYETYLHNQEINSIVIYNNRELEATLVNTDDGMAERIKLNIFPSDLDSLSIKDYRTKFGIEKITLEDTELGIADYLIQFSPWILIIFFWFFIRRKMQGGGGQSGVFGFGKSRAKIVAPGKSGITFKDVAGCDEAKVELREIVQFLKHPKKFNRLGAQIPKGALLLGPPGTGKTLLAKAVSGEANVPYFSISGAEFVEMFVGVGASRVRDLFEQAKRNSPSIIFIDEIDAVGRQRGAGLGGGHDEREQTLNQILVEMDGFNTDTNVILIAATNRPDVLDKALLRPGRFDRQIVVDGPSVDGREAIMKIHVKGVPLAKNVKLSIIAKGTPGLVGADLKNLVNEAALLAARRNRKVVTMTDFEDAKDKVMMGVERKSLILTEEERKITAYHEAGHALTAHYTEGADPVHKITIVPRGRALGITAQLPTSDKHNYSEKYLTAKLCVLMGGRSAEKLIFKETSTGAGNDISVATDISKKMVCEWGMSKVMGPISYGNNQDEVFLGRDISKGKDFGPETSKLIDQEIARFIKNAEIDADTLLKNKEDKLHDLANALLEIETLSGEDMIKVFEGIKLEKKEEPKIKKRRRRRKPSPEKSLASKENTKDEKRD